MAVIAKSLWIPEDSCTGCGSCLNICPVDAIVMKPNELGFSIPLVGDACTGCNACERACPIYTRMASDNSQEPITLAAWSKDDAIRFNSTSGGLFSALAYEVIREGGVVFGAAYDDMSNVGHQAAYSEQEVEKLRQSKYVQSDMGLSYRAVKVALGSGKKVLFCGAPCQIAGLKSFLGGGHASLVAVEFVCRGVNSPKAYRAWLDEIEDKAGQRVTRVWFKYKQGGWHSSPRRTRIVFEDGSDLVQDGDENLFMTGYLGPDLYMRPCCGSCEFKGFPRFGDITLADFWGIDKSVDDDKGVSLVLLNSEVGQRAFHRIKSSIFSEERQFEEAVSGNVCIYESAWLNPSMRAFLKALDEMPFSEALAEFSKLPIGKRIGDWCRGKARFLKSLVNRMFD